MKIEKNPNATIVETEVKKLIEKT
ncbi:hypothetical protein BCO_0900097 (plasmid) [Borrelia coriaceae ATCC 43381]|uniref:Uncharacterized protein n=1 Tax=Borrelia coriaceae ATCC 43381 TaxID=1408429 RepID=W5SXE3_9SPIR|nr:hypothetical protein BCO_0900097 [Borrelia coriaceae ATCC 43381]